MTRFSCSVSSMVYLLDTDHPGRIIQGTLGFYDRSPIDATSPSC